MTELIACLSSGKGTWGHVNRIIQDQDWDKIFLITNEFGKENFTSEKESEFILIQQNQGIIDLRDQIISGLKNKVKGPEVAVNFVSGTGKEHLALMSALLKLGLGIRLIALTKEGIQEL